MTVSSTYSADTYSGNGVLDTYGVSFNFLGVSTNVKVSIKVDSTGAVTEKTATTHYNVSGLNVVFTAGNIPASGETIIIELNPDFKQESDYAENNEFPAETVEADLDERTLEGQINNSLTANSLKVDAGTASNMSSTTLVASSTAATNGGKFIKFNTDGTGFEVQTLSATAGLGNVVEDTSPQLGANLDTNNYNVSIDDDRGLIDDTGNEQLMFRRTTDAVNHIEIQNSATGTSPVVRAQGDDTNISLQIDSQGTGNLILGSADTTTIRLNTRIDTNGNNVEFEDGNGLVDDSENEVLMVNKEASAVNYIEVKNSASGATPRFTALGDDTNVGIILDTKGTGELTYRIGGTTKLDLDENGMRLGLANARVTTVLDEDNMASDSNTALATQQSIKQYTDSRGASQAQMEAASSTTTYATPGNTIYHPGVAKGWVNFTGTGTVAISESHNVTSITDNGVGNYTINWNTSFASSGYAATLTGDRDTASSGASSGFSIIRSQTTSALQISTQDIVASSADWSSVQVAAFGDR